MTRRRHGQLEADVMAILWSAQAPQTPRDVRDALPSSAYTTVLTALTRLHKKGLVSRVPQGRSFAYQPVETTADFTARRMRDLLDQADPAAVLSRFVESLDAAEETLLRRLLSEADEG
jgi:predicted transcriptional regulator